MHYFCSIFSSNMPRPKKKRINKDCTKKYSINLKTRNLVECKCILHCHGSKLVDPKTLKKHQEEVEWFCIITSESHGTFQLSNTKSKSDNIGSPLNSSNLKKEKISQAFHHIEI